LLALLFHFFYSLFDVFVVLLSQAKRTRVMGNLCVKDDAVRDLSQGLPLPNRKQQQQHVAKDIAAVKAPVTASASAPQPQPQSVAHESNEKTPEVERVVSSVAQSTTEAAAVVFASKTVAQKESPAIIEVSEIQPTITATSTAENKQNETATARLAAAEAEAQLIKEKEAKEALDAQTRKEKEAQAVREAEARRVAEEQKEALRIADEKKQKEAAHVAEAARIAEEEKKQKEALQMAEEERKQEEALRLAEEQKAQLLAVEARRAAEQEKREKEAQETARAAEQTKRESVVTAPSVVAEAAPAVEEGGAIPANSKKCSDCGQIKNKKLDYSKSQQSKPNARCKDCVEKISLAQ